MSDEEDKKDAEFCRLNSVEEDFADSVAEYFVSHDVFVAGFPARARAIKELFRNV